MEKNLVKKMVLIQQKLKAPKNQRNNFGKYNYRSCEDIMEGVKPLLAEQELLLTVTDTVEFLEGRFYVKATATVTDGEKSISTAAYAREPEVKKGMDDSQITGSCSSYARKYALNGLFAIDDTKDSDIEEYQSKAKTSTKQVAKQVAKKEVQTPISNELKTLLHQVASMAKAKNLSANRMKEIMQLNFKVKESKNLTVEQAATLLDILKGAE